MTPISLPTPETCAFLLEVGEAWGQQWMRVLAHEIKRGTFTHLDGEMAMKRLRPGQKAEVRLKG